MLQLEKIFFTSNIVIIIDNLSMYECQNKIGDHYPAAGGGSEAGPVWGEVQELVAGTRQGPEPPQPGQSLKQRLLVSIVSYRRPSLMIIASQSQFHVERPWGQRLFSIVS